MDSRIALYENDTALVALLQDILSINGRGGCLVIEKPLELDRLLAEVTAAAQRAHEDPTISSARAGLATTGC